MKTFEEAKYLIESSKRFDFEDGPNGTTILTITNYYSGEKLFLDLAKIDEETLEKLQVVGSTEDIKERCMSYIHKHLTDDDEETLTMLLDKVAEHQVKMSRIDYNFYTYLRDLVCDFCDELGIDYEDFDEEDFINNQLY